MGKNKSPDPLIFSDPRPLENLPIVKLTELILNAVHILNINKVDLGSWRVDY